jgi:hypothetical protein
VGYRATMRMAEQIHLEVPSVTGAGIFVPNFRLTQAEARSPGYQTKQHHVKLGRGRYCGRKNH